MQLQRQHVDSTKTADDYEYVPEDEPKEKPNSKVEPRSKKHKVGAYLIDDMTNMVVMDITGRYPVTSKDGHKYIFVLLDFSGTPELQNALFSS